VTVTLKLVQVYVTDKEGKPVPDLRLADFKLFDNGKPVTITEFEKHTLLLPEKRQEEPGILSPPGPSTLSRRFFLFFDFLFNNPQGLERAKKAALHFLDNQAQASDEIGILSYSLYKGLTLHEYLTTDHQKVREVVEGFDQKDMLGRAQNLEAEYWNAMRDMTHETSPTSPGTRPDSLLNPAKQKLLDLSIDRMNYQLHVRNFVQKMTELARSFRLIPGYKYLILFSSGIAGSIFQGGPVAMDRHKMVTAQREGNAGLYNTDSLDAAVWEEKKYENMVKELAQANCPVFVLNTEVLGQDPALNKAMSGEYPLKKLSKISGGAYFPRVDDYENSLAQVQDMTGMYYVLGYPIRAEEDGKFHEIKVRVERKGCEVRAQGGYFNPKPFRDYTGFEKTIHLLDAALTENPQLRNPAGFPLAALACPTDQEPLLVLLSRIPKEIFDQAGKGRNEVVTIILDGQKNIVTFKRATVDFAAVSQSELCHYTYSLLPPGDYDCRVVIRNLDSGQTAVAKESTRIPGGTGSPLTILPPLLLRPGSETYYFGVQRKGEAGAQADTPSLTTIYPYETKEYSPWANTLPAGSPEVYALVGCGFGEIPEPDLELSFSLKEASSDAEIPIPHSLLSVRPYSQEEGERSWLALLCRLELPSLKAGEHIFKVAVKEATTKSEAESVQKLAIQ
jgi:VWFA-related protein